MRPSARGPIIDSWKTAAPFTGSRTISRARGSRTGRKAVCRRSRRTSPSTSRSSAFSTKPRPRFHQARGGQSLPEVAEFKPSYLIEGLPGHPLHPPLTDATIGTYTFATIAAVLSKLGVADHAFAQAWWLALVLGLVTTVFTALTGLVDWLKITWGSELWKTATLHL